MKNYILLFVIIIAMLSVGWITHVKNWWIEDAAITSSTINSTPIGGTTASSIAATTISGTTIAGTLLTGSTSISGTVITGTVNVGVVAGDADSLNLTCSPSYSALATGMTVFFIADSANTTAVTCVLDGLAEKAVKECHDNSALDANDIKAGQAVLLIYDGTNFQQISQSGN